MHTFTQRVKHLKTPASSSLARAHTVELGNQALHSFKTEAKKIDAGSTGTLVAGFEFDRISIHPFLEEAIQSKPAINEPGDEYEQEADRVADQMMRTQAPQISVDAARPLLSRKCVACEDGRRLYRSEIEAERHDNPGQETTTQIGSADAPALVNEVLRSTGEPLEPAARTFLEKRFGHEFGHVRVHTDAKAVESAAAVNARAYTVGSHIVFGGGRYAPGSADGRRLLAHELTHVVQQRGAAKGHTQKFGNQTVQRFLHGPRIQRFGEPENVPDMTYISGVNVSGGDARSDAFLKEATNYHEHWGLKPKAVKSMEELIGDLGKGKGVLSRVRIVSHAWENRLFLGLFEGDTPGIDKNTLKAIAEGETALLNQLVGPVSGVNVNIDSILNVLRSSNAEVLAPFGLDAARSAPTPPVKNLIVRAATLWVLVKGTGEVALVREMRTAIERILPELRRRLTRPAPEGAGVTEAQAKALQDAIVALEPDPATPLKFEPTPESIAPIKAANKAFARGFSDKLKKARARFSDSSWIDIRGCKVGDQPDYMNAVSAFFGGSSAKPHVSAPEWVQLFRSLSYKELDDADIASAASDQGVSTALDHWAAVTGANAKMSGLKATEDKLKVYLDEALVLPVRPGAMADNLKLYVKKSLKDKAFDKWLASQWKPDAPGLKALKKAGLKSVDARWVAGLSDKLTTDGEIVVSPDPDYKAHIKET